jgi:hypothetical protein
MTLHKAVESAWLLLGTLPVLANSMHDFPAEYVFENMFFKFPIRFSMCHWQWIIP